MKTIFLLVVFIIACGIASDTLAAERTITIAGRVDVSGLDKPSGSFTVRALQPQKRSVELARSTTDAAGNFQLNIDSEALALYGVVLEAASTGNRALVLEAAVLHAREAAAVVVDPSSTLEAAILGWKIQANDGDFDTIRPGPLSTWLRPIADAKTRERLKRAYAAVARWAAGAAAGSQTTATLVRAAVGDVRFMSKRLGDLGVRADAVAQLSEMSRKDPEVAYVLMMPYFLDL